MARSTLGAVCVYCVCECLDACLWPLTPDRQDFLPVERSNLLSGLNSRLSLYCESLAGTGRQPGQLPPTRPALLHPRDTMAVIMSPPT